MTCFVINGESLNKYCKRNGISYNSVWNRIEKGWDLQKAIETPFLPPNGTKYFINGKSARSQMTKNEYQRYRLVASKEAK